MAIAILNNTTKKLQVLLGGAVSATECPITVGYEDVRKDALAGGNESSPVYGSDDAITTGATAVDVVDAPPTGIRRVVTQFSLYNADSAEVDVTVRLYVTSSTTRILYRGKLQTLETLQYSESRGWYGTDVNSNQKTNATGTSSTTSEALSAATSAATRASTADSKALSVSTLTSTADSKGVSAGSVGSVADSKALSVSTVLSTNDSIDDSRDTSSATRFSIVESTANSG